MNEGRCPKGARPHGAEVHMVDPENAGAEQGESKRPMATCADCGREYARQRQVERLKQKLGGAVPRIDFCPACRRRLYAEGLCEAQLRADS